MEHFLLKVWNNGNRNDVVREIMSYQNSHTAAINFFMELDEKQGRMFLVLVERWEEDQYFGRE